MPDYHFYHKFQKTTKKTVTTKYDETFQLSQNGIDIFS